MTKPTKTLNDIGAVVVTDDTAVSYLTPETYASIMALIEDRKRLLDEVERLKAFSVWAIKEIESCDGHDGIPDDFKIAEPEKIYQEGEMDKNHCCPRCGESTYAPGELCRNCPPEPPQEKGYGPR